MSSHEHERPSVEGRGLFFNRLLKSSSGGICSWKKEYRGDRNLGQAASHPPVLSRDENMRETTTCYEVSPSQGFSQHPDQGVGRMFFCRCAREMVEFARIKSRKDRNVLGPGCLRGGAATDGSRGPEVASDPWMPACPVRMRVASLAVSGLSQPPNRQSVAMSTPGDEMPYTLANS